MMACSQAKICKKRQVSLKKMSQQIYFLKIHHLRSKTIKASVVTKWILLRRIVKSVCLSSCLEKLFKKTSILQNIVSNKRKLMTKTPSKKTKLSISAVKVLNILREAPMKALTSSEISC